MSIDATTLDDQLSDFIFRSTDTQDVLGNGRNIPNEIQTNIQQRIMDLLYRGNRLSELLAFKLAWLGSAPEQRPLIAKEIVYLIRTPEGTIRPVKWKTGNVWNSTCKFFTKSAETVGEFWEDHKTEVLIGIGIVAVVVTAAVVIAYTGGSAAEPVIAIGAATINNLLKNSPEKETISHTSMPAQQTFIGTTPSSLSLPEISILSPQSAIDQTVPSFVSPFNVDSTIPIKLLEVPLIEKPESNPKIETPIAELPISFDPFQWNSQFYPLPNFPNFPEYRPPASTSPTQPFALNAGPASTSLSETSIPSPYPGIPYTIDPEWGPKLYTTWKPTSTSQNFEILGDRLAHGRIGGIAGINTSQTQNESYAHSIRTLAKDHHVDWTYNASHSLPVDLAESVFVNYAGHSAPAKLLIESWTKFAKDYENDPQAKYFQICHSQGAIHVKNALQECPEELRKRIIVLAIAPGEIVPKVLCYDSYNYASRRDVVPYGKFLTERQNIENLAALTELIILDPHPEAPWFDHGFESPTFDEAKQRHIEEYIEKYGK